MLRVNLVSEPPCFDERVRQRGIRWLERHNIPLSSPCPEGIALAPYWREVLDDLYYLYGGYCSYSSVRFELAPGGMSVDHFVAKSKLAGRAYEWDNYRLACVRLNSKKGVISDVLDPFEVEDGWFQLDLFTGKIHANDNLDSGYIISINNTIDKLYLNSPIFCSLRRRIIIEYILHGERELLRHQSLFIYFEMERQGYL